MRFGLRDIGSFFCLPPEKIPSLPISARFLRHFYRFFFGKRYNYVAG